MTSKDRQELPGPSVPEPERLVERRRRDVASVGRELDVVDELLVTCKLNVFDFCHFTFVISYLTLTFVIRYSTFVIDTLKTQMFLPFENRLYNNNVKTINTFSRIKKMAVIIFKTLLFRVCDPCYFLKSNSDLLIAQSTSSPWMGSTWTSWSRRTPKPSAPLEPGPRPKDHLTKIFKKLFFSPFSMRK